MYDSIFYLQQATGKPKNQRYTQKRKSLNWKLEYLVKLTFNFLFGIGVEFTLL